jgi:hypothetical protein
MSLEQREQLLPPEEKIWIGKDISLRQNTVFPPKTTIPVYVQSEAGSFPHEISEEEEDRLSASMRSRYAQIGLHPAGNVPRDAMDAFLSADEGEEQFKFRLGITNSSLAPIFLERGTSLLRFYITPNDFIKNGELQSLIDNNSIEIDGQENRDWRYEFRENSSRESKDIIGIALKVKDDNRKYIPRGYEQISIRSDERQYRDEVDRFLRDISIRSNPYEACLWIGETVGLNLHGKVAAEIEREALPSNTNIAPWKHIDSRLVDPSTGWPVRVEIFSPTQGDQVADWVVFKFFHQ